MIISCDGSFNGCEKLSKEGCRFEEAYGAYHNRYERFVCDNLNANFEMSNSEMAMCKKTSTLPTDVYFKLSSPQILDRSLNLTSLNKFLRGMNRFNPYEDTDMISITVKYSNLRGFDLNASFFSDEKPTKSIIFYIYEIYDSEFQFFLNNQLQVSCEDFLKSNLTEPKSFFQIASHTNQSQTSVYFYDIEFSKTPICPLYFKNVNLDDIVIYYQINTFYKKNYLKFSRLNNTDKFFFNSNIEILWTYRNEKIDIDSNSFLNKYLFHNLKGLALFGEINSIEKDIFKTFRSLINIYFDLTFFGKLSRKGTEWISSINFDLHVNLSNRSDLDLHINETKLIHLVMITISNAEKETINIFPNEDFCLFRNYPFDQLVLFKIVYLQSLFDSEYTCTIQWVLKHVYLYARFPHLRRDDFIDDFTFSDFLASNQENISDKFKKCDFVKMIENCNRENYATIDDNSWTINDSKEVSLLIEFIFIILLLIICFLGLLSNFMIIYTLSLKENEKDFTKVHYPYLKMASVSNIVVLLINILSPIYECQPHQGIFCSSIHKSLFSQYYKIIFGEFICTVFMMISNFGYVGFSLTRLSLIGKDHSKLIKFISELKMPYYILTSTIISVALSVVKIFRYQVNGSDPDQDYPIRYDRNYNNMFSADFATKARVINVFNAISDLTNYLVFVLIDIILDIVLVRKFRKTMTDKINSEEVKITQVVFRIITLVVEFALFSIILKLPSSLKSVFDSIHLNNDLVIPLANNQIDFLYEWYCVYARFCPTFDKLSSILFAISISSNLFFYYLFDRNFKFGLKIAFNKLISNRESHLDYVKKIEELRSKK